MARRPYSYVILCFQSQDLDFFSGGSNCPAPFVEVMSECFSLSRTRLPWHHARHYCLGMGGDLATPSFIYALKTYILEREGEIFSRLKDGRSVNPLF